MLKKVKSKQYKSKREFKDDLDLIWSNCYQYNAAEVSSSSPIQSNLQPTNAPPNQNHPLRQCVKRLKLKADRLLKYITDRKERTDPPIPTDLAVTHIARPRINGHGHGHGHGPFVNGRTSHSHTPLSNHNNNRHQRSPSLVSNISKPGTPEFRPSSNNSSFTAGIAKHVNNLTSNAAGTSSTTRKTLPFADTPAIIRTPSGMASFLKLDEDVRKALGESTGAYTMGKEGKESKESVDTMKRLAGPIVSHHHHQQQRARGGREEEGEERDADADMEIDMDSDSSMGDKRKAYVFPPLHPSQRLKLTNQNQTPQTPHVRVFE